MILKQLNRRPQFRPATSILAIGFSLCAFNGATAQTAAPAAVANPAADPAASNTSPATGAATQTPTTAPAAAGGNQKLEEIVVTAQRRGENMQKVPISVSAVTADMARSMGLTNAKDLSIAAPAVTFTETNSGANITIRGVAGSGSAVDEAANAVYIDGVYQAATPGLLFDLNNIERVEIEKGPQGTLFGRNSTGGTIQIITRQPSDKPIADLSAGYGNFGTFEGQAYVSGPLAEGLTADLAVVGRNQQDGWGKNLYDGRDAYKGRSLFTRGKIRWEVSPDTTITLTGMHSYAAPPQVAGGAIVPGETTKSAGGVAGVGNPGFYNIDQNAPSKNIIRQNQGSINIEHDLGFAKLLDIASYSKTTLDFYQDLDAGPANVSTYFIHNPVETTTEELQLQSLASSRIKWAAGFYFYKNDITLAPAITTGLSVGPPPEASTVRATSYDTSYAGFGQATVPLIWNTNLTFGARYTVDFRHERGTTISPTGKTAEFTFNNTDRSPTFRVSLDHSFTPAILGYVSYNTGYKSGLYNLTSPSAPPVNPEHVYAVEGGLKTELFDHHLRFNISAFHYKFDGIQIKAYTAQAVSVLLNATAANVTGLDADILVRPFRNFTIQGAMTYLDSRYQSFKNAPVYSVNPAGGLISGIGDASDNETIFSPKWSGSVAAFYKVPTQIGEFGISTTLYYNGGYFFDPQNRLSQNSYALVNSEISWKSRSGALEALVYIRNIGDKKYYAFATASALGDEYWPGAPRTYGLTIRVLYR